MSVVLDSCRRLFACTRRVCPETASFRTRVASAVKALMELGATVCTVSSPGCSACPVQASCLAHRLTAAGSGGTKGLKADAISKKGSASTGSKALQTGTSSAAISSQGEASAMSSTAVSRDRTCGCAVCEVGGDGMAAMPVAVTDFPRKAAKT